MFQKWLAKKALKLQCPNGVGYGNNGQPWDGLCNPGGIV